MDHNESYAGEYHGGKHFNLLLLVGGLLGAVVGFVAGEILLLLLTDRMHPIPLVGIYFAQLTFFIFLAVLICEKIDPRLNSRIWTNDHWSDSLKRLPVMSIVAFFALGCLLQFLYGLSAAKTALQTADDYILCIDNSGSMSSSDTAKDRFAAVLSFADELGEDQQVAVILFSDQADIIAPLTPVDNGFRESLRTAFNELEPDGGTDIQAALELAAEIPQDTARNTMVILLSDGESWVNISEITDLYNNRNLVLNTIDCSGNQLWRNRVLLNLSTSTGGMNYQIPEMNQLAGTFTRILSGTQNARNLLDYRYGFDRASTLFMVLRILFIALIGVAISLGLAVMLYNTQVIRRLLPCKIITGILAGAVLEYGLYHFGPALLARFLMVFLLGLFVSLFQSTVPYLTGSRGDKELARVGGSQW